MRSCIAYANKANIVNKDSPFGSGAEVSRICYTCMEFLTFGFVRITWRRHYTTVCYLNMNTSTKTIIPKKRKGKQITWKVCPNSIAVDVCSWRFNQPFTSLWMNSRFTCKRTCRGTRPNAHCHMNGFARGPVLTQRQRQLGDSLLNSFSAPTETNAYLSPLIFSLGVDSGMVSGRLAPIDILRIFSIGTPLFLKRTSSWVISSSF